MVTRKAHALALASALALSGCLSSPLINYVVFDSGDLVRLNDGRRTLIVPRVDDGAMIYDVYAEATPALGPVLVRERFGGNRQMLLVPITPELEVRWALSLSIDMTGSLGKAEPVWRGVELKFARTTSLNDSIWDTVFEELERVEGSAPDSVRPHKPRGAGDELDIPTLVYFGNSLVGTTTYLAPGATIDPRTLRRADP